MTYNISAESRVKTPELTMVRVEEIVRDQPLCSLSPHSRGPQ